MSHVPGSPCASNFPVCYVTSRGAIAPIFESPQGAMHTLDDNIQAIEPAKLLQKACFCRRFRKTAPPGNPIIALKIEFTVIRAAPKTEFVSPQQLAHENRRNERTQ